MGTILRGPLEVLDHGVVMDAAKHLLLNQAEFLSGGQLALAGEAGEAGQVVGVAASPPHPVTGIDLSAASGALSSKSATGQRGTKFRKSPTLSLRALTALGSHGKVPTLESITPVHPSSTKMIESEIFIFFLLYQVFRIFYNNHLTFVYLFTMIFHER